MSLLVYLHDQTKKCACVLTAPSPPRVRRLTLNSLSDSCLLLLMLLLFDCLLLMLFADRKRLFTTHTALLPAALAKHPHDVMSVTVSVYICVCIYKSESGIPSLAVCLLLSPVSSHKSLGIGMIGNSKTATTAQASVCPCVTPACLFHAVFFRNFYLTPLTSACIPNLPVSFPSSTLRDREQHFWGRRLVTYSCLRDVKRVNVANVYVSTQVPVEFCQDVCEQKMTLVLK